MALLSVVCAAVAAGAAIALIAVVAAQGPRPAGITSQPVVIVVRGER